MACVLCIPATGAIRPTTVDRKNMNSPKKPVKAKVMAARIRAALIAVIAALTLAFCAYAQLRPEVTVKAKPKKPPATKPAPEVTPKPTQIIVETSPGAEVYLDDQFVGRASPQGRLVIGNPKAGDHGLRVSLTGKRDYQENVSAAVGQVTKVTASLADLPEITTPSPTGTRADLEATKQALTRAKGELSGAIARTHDELIVLAQRTDRDYFEFDLPRINAREKIGTVIIELVGTNPEKNHFTVYLYFDDKRTERKDKAINEPVYFYMQGASTALELVVNKLGKDSTSGYISTPKGFFPNTPNVLTPGPGQGEAEKVLPPGAVRENPKDGLKYVWIPPGTFMMGCSPGDSECQDDEKPAHRVTITKGFWLGQTEVTVGAYKRFARGTGRAMPEEPKFQNNALNPSWGNEQMPVVNVSWSDAVAYCRWAGGRLPTEAEWEYAARAGSTEAHYGSIDDVAWYADNSGRSRIDTKRIFSEEQNNYLERLAANWIRMHEVAQKRANAWSLYDMLGNVWEWVNDWYDEGYYQNSPSQDPSGASSGKFRLLRGGSYDYPPERVRVSDRGRLVPGDTSHIRGLRCGREAE